MWQVLCDYESPGVLAYFVEREETGERCGSFDSEERAKEFADELNGREQDVRA